MLVPLNDRNAKSGAGWPNRADPGALAARHRTVSVAAARQR
jgi:hypothetical protein